MAIPQQIGRYQIKAEVGRGGMAVVYQALDPRFDREVAIKVLPHEFMHDPTFRARFEQESRIIAALDHPAIVPVYDTGEHEGQPFLVMRYMGGGSLAERIQGGPLSLVEAARIITRLAPALDEAHARGIIHRDIKPSNILFDQRDEPHLADFGIVKLSEASAALTGSGIIGTPAYMSPEQAQGRLELDARSDIYSLGVILFEMLTQTTPFQADTPVGLVVKHILEPVPDILALNPHLPPECEEIVKKAMAKDPAVRYATVGSMARDLAAIAGYEFTPVSPHGVILARTLVDERAFSILAVGAEWAIGFAILGTLLNASGWAATWADQVALKIWVVISSGAALGGALAARGRVWQGKRPAPITEVWTAAWAAGWALLIFALDAQGWGFTQPWAWGIAGAIGGAIAEGMHLLPSLTITKGLSPFTKKLESGFRVAPRPLPPPAAAPGGRARQPAGAANQAAVRAAKPRPLKLAPPSGFERYKTLDGHTDRVYSVAWSPDSRWLASGAWDGSVIVWDVLTGNPVRRMSLPNTRIECVAFSPDGETLAAGAWNRSVTLWRIASGKPVRTLEGHDEAVYAVDFSPDGTWLASASWDRSVIVWDAHTGTPTQALKGHTEGVESVAFSPDGQLLASGAADKLAIMWEAATGVIPHLLAAHTDRISSVAWSPDGALLASGSDDHTTILWDRRTGERKRVLAGHSQAVSCVAWSPGGEALASASEDCTLKIWDRRTGDCLHTLESDDGAIFCVAWSPDGKWLVSGSEDRMVTLWRIAR